MASPPRSLLILRLSALGDVIHTMPAVSLLRAAFPETTMRWVVEASYAEMIEVVTGIETIPVRLKKWGRSPFRSRRDIGVARRSLRGSDVSVDFQGLIKSATLGWLSGASLRYGFARGAIKEPPALAFINRPVPVDVSAHVIEQNLELARGVAGAPAVPRPLDWSRYAEQAEQFREYDGAVVLLPGAGKANKLWPVERFAELARTIGPRVVTAWGPGERSLAEAVGARTAPPTSIRELAAILARASVVIGGDTGPLHLAAALGRPVIGLYAPTDPRRNGPYGQLHHCVDKYPSTKLMDSITVSEVMSTFERVAAE